MYKHRALFASCRILHSSTGQECKDKFKLGEQDNSNSNFIFKENKSLVSCCNLSSELKISAELGGKRQKVKLIPVSNQLLWGAMTSLQTENTDWKTFQNADILDQDLKNYSSTSLLVNAIGLSSLPKDQLKSNLANLLFRPFQQNTVNFSKEIHINSIYKPEIFFKHSFSLLT